MRKLFLTLISSMLVSFLYAQQEEGAKEVTVSQAIQNEGFTIQVGLPFLGTSNNTTPTDLRFPWDVLYLYGTFAEESFSVSKGYFGDKVLIEWRLRNNINNITNIKILRRELGSNENFQPIADITPQPSGTYEDKYVDGGKLYEYKVLAENVMENEELFTNYITGIGFRNPTAVITGNVNFEGGNPVKNVTVVAESSGSSISYGSSLKIPSNAKLEINKLNKPIDSLATLQAWVKPDINSPYTDDNGSPIRLFRLTEANGNNIDVNVRVKILANELEVKIKESLFLIKNVFPSGDIDARGDDIMVPVANFNDYFTHFSIQLRDGMAPSLFINGRPMTKEYRDAVHKARAEIDQNINTPYLEISEDISLINFQLGKAVWNKVRIGGGKTALIDEIRLWNRIETAAAIRTDYKRYISGDDPGLIVYLSANENQGDYAYDASREDYTYNRNHGKLENITFVSGPGAIPSASQLGILGVTDENGNYQINSIPYSGTGESFKITPVYGQHKFEPNQQLVFLGQGSEVVNKIDFIDKSSFIFKGKILYDTRKVFPSYVEVNGGNLSGLNDGDEYVTGPGIIDENYNRYEKLTGANAGTYNKGEYWINYYDENDSTNFRLERYASIPVSGATIYIDGQIVIDENNTPVLSDEAGNFEISVPIGNHFIRVEKNGHSFSYNGRFPAETGTFKEFFEDAQEPVVFIDETRVTAVGRVVGGAVEASKPIGFGENGLYVTNYTIKNFKPIPLVVSSKNNIGVASFAFQYDPPGAGGVTDYTKFNFKTNSESGEYRVEVMPLNYEIEGGDIPGLTISSNESINSAIIGTSNESINFSSIPPLLTPEFILPNNDILEGVPYHFEKSFVYRSTPVLRVIDQTSTDSLQFFNADSSEYFISTEGLTHPADASKEVLIYEQAASYAITLSTFERYVNMDGDSIIEDVVPIIDGELKINNNLAILGSEEIEKDTVDNSISYYSFQGGVPNTTFPYTRSLDIQYVIGGISYPAENYIPDGIILGGAPDGTSAPPLTVAPEIPDIILRDPPGSNSFASIEAGQTLSFTTESMSTLSGGLSQTLKLMMGGAVTFVGGVPGASIEVKTEVVNDLTGNITLETSSSDALSLTKTYTFNQTISTSDDPEFVGADGDLYIGNASNYAIGSYDDFKADIAPIGDPNNNYRLTNANGDDIYLNKQKAIYINTKPTNTFFVYSQKYIINDLIPQYELIAENLRNHIPVEGANSLFWYEEQIRLWRKIILENERKKYLALNESESLIKAADDYLDIYMSDLENELNRSDVGDPYQALLKEKLDLAASNKSLVNSQSSGNISFDSGVGEVSRSVETELINSSSLAYNIELEESLQYDIGFEINDALGLVSTTVFSLAQDFSAGITKEEAETTTFKYTLKDNDPANILSIDVFNLFDGNGPVFTTVGGRTSCPYEGKELSHFYNHSSYDPANPIVALAEADRETLSNATQKAEDPQITVDVAEIFNIPESNTAEFHLSFQNLADATSDNANFNYFELIIDNTTNPSAPDINVSPNGTVIFVPYGQTVDYTLTLDKKIADVYDYENIRVVLQSLCDPVNVFDDVLISAHFIPTCSQVKVSAPRDNWVYNIDAAYDNHSELSKPLLITLSDYNQTFDNFKKIDLEYRLATSPNWTRLHTYYNTEAFYDEAVGNGETEVALIETPNINFPFDIAGLQLQDGVYEIRARSICENGTVYISDVISGTVNLEAPRQFGTPFPINGILGVGEDLRVKFNENMYFNSAVSTIEIKGQSNQLPIDHSVSLYFEGDSNTVTIESPRLVSGDLTLEFWMNNSTTESTATIVEQKDGLTINLEDHEIFVTLGDITAHGTIANDELFHHYTFSHNNELGTLSIYEDDREIGGDAGSANTAFTNNNPLIIGGNSFIGNIHDLRLWSVSKTLSDAYAGMYSKLQGKEANLVGYWPLNEGRGELANDLARFKHALVKAEWDIKPKGTAYSFSNGQYLALDDVGFVQMTNEMDATISFWIKTETPQEATIFSNGRGIGDGTLEGKDPIQSNGLANKWSINMNTSGALYLASEENTYVLTAASVADNSWHHITLLFNRNGALRTYVDAQQVSSNPMTNIGGFSGDKVWIGARGFRDLGNKETVDRVFTGKIDEFRLWNTLRNVDQISRDRYHEIDVESIGLLLYARMNAPNTATDKGPLYYHVVSGGEMSTSYGTMNAGAVNFSNDVPAIKPERNLIKFQVNHVINEDEMILEPVISDWAVVEGQVLDITVHRMFDASDNMQQSPITWTAFIQKNEMSWFVDGHNDVVDLTKIGEEATFFEISILNKGGQTQPFAISGIPSWLSLSSSSGTLLPDSKVVITASVDEGLATGEYIEDLYLQTDFGLDEKLQLKLRVLAEDPDWVIDPNSFNYSMNIVGRVSIDGVYSDDIYDKVSAFSNGELRGVADMVWDEAYQEYFVFLTVYSDSAYSDLINFKIWDASKGQVVQATLDEKLTVTFNENTIIGTQTNTSMFENSGVVEQIIQLNQGWTWLSLNIEDKIFSNLNVLTEGMVLETSDRLMSNSPSKLETYFKNENSPESSSWNGEISEHGGLSTSYMYKAKFNNRQDLILSGSSVNLDSWSFPIKLNWNWLPYPLKNNVALNEGLSSFDAHEGDVIKSQNQFAIYDEVNGWSGTLNYLEANKGYMLRSSQEQIFTYPRFLWDFSNSRMSNLEIQTPEEVISAEFARFSANMNAVVLLPEGYHELFAIDDKGDLRGKAVNQVIGNQNLSFITVFGETNKELTFYIGDGERMIPTHKTFHFTANNVLGTVENPVVLGNEILGGIKIFPSPFKEELQIKLISNQDDFINIQLFNTFGQLVNTYGKSINKGINTLILNPDVGSGLYILKIKFKNTFLPYTFKVIKE